MYHADNNAVIVRPTFTMISELFPVGPYQLDDQAVAELTAITSSMKALVPYVELIENSDKTVQIMQKAQEKASNDSELQEAVAQNFLDINDTAKFITFLRTVAGAHARNAINDMHMRTQQQHPLAQLFSAIGGQQSVDGFIAVHRVLSVIMHHTVSACIIRRNPFIRFFPEACLKWSVIYENLDVPRVVITGYSENLL
jgi:hypothetical protein